MNLLAPACVLALISLATAASAARPSAVRHTVFITASQRAIPTSSGVQTTRVDLGAKRLALSGRDQAVFDIPSKADWPKSAWGANEGFRIHHTRIAFKRRF